MNSRRRSPQVPQAKDRFPDVPGCSRSRDAAGVVKDLEESANAAAARSGALIVDSQIGDRVVVLNHSVINGSRVAADASIGPFAHLRADVEVQLASLPVAELVRSGRARQTRNSPIFRRMANTWGWRFRSSMTFWM